MFAENFAKCNQLHKTTIFENSEIFEKSFFFHSSEKCCSSHKKVLHSLKNFILAKKSSDTIKLLEALLGCIDPRPRKNLLLSRLAPKWLSMRTGAFMGDSEEYQYRRLGGL